jgi:hypothetical protein
MSSTQLLVICNRDNQTCTLEGRLFTLVFRTDCSYKTTFLWYHCHFRICRSDLAHSNNKDFHVSTLIIVNRTFRSFLFPYSWLITSILTSVTGRVRLGEQELFQSTCVHSPSFSLVYAPQSLIIWVVVCGQLLIFNSFDHCNVYFLIYGIWLPLMCIPRFTASDYH